MKLIATAFFTLGLAMIAPRAHAESLRISFQGIMSNWDYEMTLSVDGARANGDVVLTRHRFDPAKPSQRFSFSGQVYAGPSGTMILRFDRPSHKQHFELALDQRRSFLAGTFRSDKKGYVMPIYGTRR